MSDSGPKKKEASPLSSQIKTLQEQCSILSHQMELIMGAFKIPHCACKTCAAVAAREQPKLVVRLDSDAAAAAAAAAATPTCEAKSEVVEAPEVSRAAAALPKILQQQQAAEDAAVLSILQNIKNVGAAATTPGCAAGAAGAAGAVNPFADQSAGGRKSKYCSTETKQAVAEYAALHGAANAARKFNIPQSVAAYYHRKLNRIKINGAVAASVASISGESGTPDGIGKLALSLNYSNSGRKGRPNLIGDELHADLIKHMAKLKADTPGLYYTPETALDVAHAYISKHSPLLLEENGGSVSLKRHWALKLITRVTEREKELELGLPAGSLHNMGRHGIAQLQQLQQQAGTGGGAAGAAADMEAMQQLLLAMAASAAGGEGEPMMPEIMECKELKLSDFLGAGMDLSERTPEGGEETEEEVDEEMEQDDLQLQQLQPESVQQAV